MSNSQSSKRLDFVEKAQSALLVQRLSSISKSVRQLVGIKLAPHGVLVGQDQFLLTLFEKGTMPCVQAANALGIRASTISKMLDILERKGWMYRHPDSEDQRRVLISLTADGMAAAKEVQGAVAELEAELASLLTDRDDIPSAIKQMDAILVKRLSRLR